MTYLDKHLTEFYEELGENIRKHRKLRNLSQDDLARLVNLTRTSMTNIEKGRQRPPLHVLCEIIEHLQVDISELLPKPVTSVESLDIKSLASPQVRGEKELAFIESAIKGVKLHGNTKKHDSGKG